MIPRKGAEEVAKISEKSLRKDVLEVQRSLEESHPELACQRMTERSWTSWNRPRRPSAAPFPGGVAMPHCGTDRHYHDIYLSGEPTTTSWCRCSAQPAG